MKITKADTYGAFLNLVDFSLFFCSNLACSRFSFSKAAFSLANFSLSFLALSLRCSSILFLMSSFVQRLS